MDYKVAKNWTFHLQNGPKLNKNEEVGKLKVYDISYIE